jgi:hypothetical protein
MIVLGKRCGCVEAAVQDVRCNCCRNAAAVCFGEIPLACSVFGVARYVESVVQGQWNRENFPESFLYQQLPL